MNIDIRADGEQVLLRSFDSSLITETYLSWFQDNKVNQYLMEQGSRTTLNDIRMYVDSLQKSSEDHFLAIFFRENEKHIGNVRIGPIDSITKKCRYGMLIGDINYHRKGIGTEVVKVASDICFKTLGMQKIYLEVFENNYAAVRIYEKNNFITEGLLRKHKKLNGIYQDIRIMSLFNS